MIAVGEWLFKRDSALGSLAPIDILDTEVGHDSRAPARRPSAVRAVCGPLRAPLMVLERGTMSIGK